MDLLPTVTLAPVSPPPSRAALSLGVGLGPALALALPSPSASPEMQEPADVTDTDQHLNDAVSDSLFALPPLAATSHTSSPFGLGTSFNPPTLHRSIVIPHHFFDTQHPAALETPHVLPPSPAPSDSCAYNHLDDRQCSPSHSDPPSPNFPTPDPLTRDLHSVATSLNLPPHLTCLARSAMDSSSPSSSRRRSDYSSNQIMAAAIICSARALRVNLSMCDTVKACGLASVHQVRPIVADMRRRSKSSAVDSGTEDAPSPRTMANSAVPPEFVGVQVPLVPSPTPTRTVRRPPRRASISVPAPHPPLLDSSLATPHLSSLSSSVPRRPSSGFAGLTPSMVRKLGLPARAHKYIEHVYRATHAQIKLLRNKGGPCHDASVLGGAIYFVGRRLHLYPVSQAKVAEAVKRTPTTVKSMYDRMCGMAEAIVPKALLGRLDQDDEDHVC